MKTLLITGFLISWLAYIALELVYRRKKKSLEAKKIAIKNSIEKTESKTYTEKEMESFGNWLLSDQRRKALKEKANKVNNTDLFNWKRKELEQVIVNEFNEVKNS